MEKRNSKDFTVVEVIDTKPSKKRIKILKSYFKTWHAEVVSCFEDEGADRIMVLIKKYDERAFISNLSNKERFIYNTVRDFGWDDEDIKRVMA